MALCEENVKNYWSQSLVDLLRNDAGRYKFLQFLQTNGFSDSERSVIFWQQLNDYQNNLNADSENGDPIDPEKKQNIVEDAKNYANFSEADVQALTKMLTEDGNDETEQLLEKAKQIAADSLCIEYELFLAWIQTEE